MPRPSDCVLQNYPFHLDRITINSDIVPWDRRHVKYAHQWRQHLDVILEKYQVRTQQKEGLMQVCMQPQKYDYNFKINIPQQGQVLVQVAPYDRRAYFRLEFNPSFFDPEGHHQIIDWLQVILGEYYDTFLRCAYVSRLDFNIDFLGLRRKELYCKLPWVREHKVYRDAARKAFETSYIGSQQSFFMVVVYDKNAERRDRGKPLLYPNYKQVTRVELRFRPKKNEVGLNQLSKAFEGFFSRLEFYRFPSRSKLLSQVHIALIRIIDLIRIYDMGMVFKAMDRQQQQWLSEHLQRYRVFPLRTTDVQRDYQKAIDSTFGLLLEDYQRAVNRNLA